jgi:HEAT repeat protein
MTRRLTVGGAVLGLVLTGGAVADVLVEPPPGDPAVIELLSGIDFVPARNALDRALGEGAVTELIALARGESDEADPGVRIRAYRALADYPAPATQRALTEAVGQHAAFDRGIDLVYLRAAVDSLARVAGPEALVTLAPLLDHPSRDVRAGAADALAETGAPGAVLALRRRLQIESVEQVRLALSAAIRALGG